MSLSDSDSDEVDDEDADDDNFLLDLDEKMDAEEEGQSFSAPQSAGSTAFYSPPSLAVSSLRNTSAVSSLSNSSGVDSFSLLSTTPLEYSRGSKGKITAHHMIPRKRKGKDISLSFVNDVFRGDLEMAKAVVSTFVEATRNKQLVAADGVILSLIAMNATQRQLKHVLKIGSTRYDRIKAKEEKKVRGGSINGRELTPSIENDIAAFITSLNYEEGYPCADKRMKRYICDEGIDTWKNFHERYLQFFPDPSNPVRKVAYTTLHRYMHGVHRDILLHRTREDECDECTRLMTSLGREGGSRGRIN
jgi:hypothetical protein